MANHYFIQQFRDGTWVNASHAPIYREPEARALAATLPPLVRIKRNHEVISDAV